MMRHPRIRKEMIRKPKISFFYILLNFNFLISYNLLKKYRVVLTGLAHIVRLDRIKRH
jgi:hypothetical protein